MCGTSSYVITLRQSFDNWCHRSTFLESLYHESLFSFSFFYTILINLFNLYECWWRLFQGIIGIISLTGILLYPFPLFPFSISLYFSKTYVTVLDSYYYLSRKTCLQIKKFFRHPSLPKSVSKWVRSPLRWSEAERRDTVDLNQDGSQTEPVFTLN